MFKKIFKVSVVFITLFYFGIVNVLAYNFVNPNNEKNVNAKINGIYDSKNLYDALYGKDEEEIKLISSDMMWWPIGSIDVTMINGTAFAIGEPQTVSRSDGFGCFAWRANKEKGETCGWHNGLDISGLGLPPGTINVIAVKDGVVVYPTKEYQTQFKDHSGSAYRNGDGGGLGNYVVVQHSDGTQSVYGHMAFNSITVMAGDTVRQGQVVGKVGHTGSSTAAHLHFGVKVGGQYVDPLDYIDPENPRPQGSNSGFSLYSTTLSKNEFVAKMNGYCDRTNRIGFCKNFASIAGDIYDVSLKNNVNPELVIVTAGAESGWTLDKACAYTNNYWGIKITNGNPCNSGGIYDSVLEGIIAYAKVIESYNPGGSLAGMINSRNNERTKAGCDAAGHGAPGTIEGMQSIYSWIGDYRYNPGNSNLGGCYYFKHIYGSNTYCDTKVTCVNYTDNRGEDLKKCPVGSRTTVCEQNDYTAWQLKKKLQIRYDIFGL